MKKIISILLVLSIIFTGFTIPVHAEETENFEPEFSTESPLDYECTYNENLDSLSVGEILHVEVKVENNTEQDYEHVWVGMGIFEITEGGEFSRIQELIAKDTEACVGTQQGGYISMLKKGQSETVVFECEIPEEWAGKNIILFGALSQTTNDTIITGDFSNYIFEEIIVRAEGYVSSFSFTSPLDWECIYNENLDSLSVGEMFHVEVKVENNTEQDYEHVWVGMGIFEITEGGEFSRIQELIAKDTEACIGTQQGGYISMLKKGQSETVVFECEIPEEWAGKNIILFGALSQTTNDTIISGDFSNYVFEEIIVRQEGFVNAESMQPDRISGTTRYETGYKIAEIFKGKMGVEKFDALIIATGKNFADALSGSYLAVAQNAPIILTNGKDDNIEQMQQYIRDNVKEYGTIYILGGEGVVPEAVENIEGYNVKRLFGNSRYDTNVEILKEAGISGGELIVATGKNYADSLSASAVKKPILLVKPGQKLNDAQKEILEKVNNGKIYIIGGDNAVSKEFETELASYGTIERIYGKNRYETSVAVAQKFYGNVESVVLASGKNFPDGLCGGPLAALLDAPLILTADKKTDCAADYIQEAGKIKVYVLGGPGALSDETVGEFF